MYDIKENVSKKLFLKFLTEAGEINHLKDKLRGFHHKAIVIQRSFRNHKEALGLRVETMSKVFWEKEKTVVCKQLLSKKTKQN